MKIYHFIFVFFVALPGFGAPGPRARDLEIVFDGVPGPLNSITDVKGVDAATLRDLATYSIKPRLARLNGVADVRFRVGDVVCAETECYGDLGATSPSGFRDMKTLGFPIVETPILASGMARCSIWSTVSMFEPTRRLADHTTSPAALLA